MYYRTRTYIAGDWDHDKDAVEALHRWNESSYESIYNRLLLNIL